MNENIETIETIEFEPVQSNETEFVEHLENDVLIQNPEFNVSEHLPDIDTTSAINTMLGIDDYSLNE